MMIGVFRNILDRKYIDIKKKPVIEDKTSNSKQEDSAGWLVNISIMVTVENFLVV